MNTYGYIYMTTNLINGKKYIGQHASSILDENYKGSGTLLRKAVCKYGVENFKVDLVEWCYSKDHLNNREKYWIAYYDAVSSEDFYNISIGGDAVMAGKHHTEETKERISKANKGRHHTDEVKKKLSEAHKGKSHSEQSRLKMSKSRKGKPMSESTRLKLIGRKCTLETRQKMSESQKGNTHWLGKHHSEETKRKIAIAHKRENLSKETLLRMSNSQKGNKNSIGHKMSEKTKQTLIACNKGNKYHLGKKHSDETKLKQSRALLGHNVSDVTRQKISNSNSNPSVETRRKMSEAKKGKTQSVTHINKRSKTFKGRIWINNGMENKWVQPTELENYLSNGYAKGRLKYV